MKPDRREYFKKYTQTRYKAKREMILEKARIKLKLANTVIEMFNLMERLKKLEIGGLNK